MHHCSRARALPHTPAPVVHADPAITGAFLSDAAHVGHGHTPGVAFPRDERETAALVRAAAHVLPVGAQSSLTGGATPRGDVVLSTRALTGIAAPENGIVRTGAGVPIATLQQRLSAAGLWYPPAPTFDGAFVGGVIATNAAGPATFKYGSTRPWVQALTVVLPSGDVLDLTRGQVTARPGEHFEVALSGGATIRIPVPRYVPPVVSKLSAGYHVARPATDLVDLFVGSEGTLGVITAASLRVVPRPRRAVAVVACRGDEQAVAVSAMLRDDARAAWEGHGALDVAAIEYMDARSLRMLAPGDLAKAGLAGPVGAALLIQLELARDESEALRRLEQLLATCGVDADPQVSVPGDRGAASLLALREAVPAAVNAAVAAAKTQRHPDIEKTAGDMVVPFECALESIRIYRRAFERRGLEYAIWGHLSDGNLHPNVIPRSLEDVEQGREALMEIAEQVIALGGAPLAEHGVGRNPVKQQLLRTLYGDEGLEQMRAVKRALDPDWKLAAGVLFGP